MDNTRKSGSLSAFQQENKNAVSGMVASIRRMVIHDGPGIRTIVFLKGCPLNCVWCAAPETQSSDSDLLFYPEYCVDCGSCVSTCLTGAIISLPGRPKTIDRSRCTVCKKCTEVCYAGALRIIGKRMTVKQVVTEVERDIIFYKSSGGGVTVSGGEPLQQFEFTRSLLQACKERGMHTAVETCGFQSWERFKTILPSLDLLLYDVKQMDPLKHKKFTGISNEIILSNLKKAVATGVETIIRTPVVPGHNDDVENIRTMGDFLKGLNGIKRVDLLPYHRLGENKYKRLGRKYQISDVPLKPEKELQYLADILIKKGFQVRIGG
jgi:pyruvate formate lyase activating enzyme